MNSYQWLVWPTDGTKPRPAAAFYNCLSSTEAAIKYAKTFNLSPGSYIVAVRSPENFLQFLTITIPTSEPKVEVYVF